MVWLVAVVHHLLEEGSVELCKLIERPQRELVDLFFVTSDGAVAESESAQWVHRCPSSESANWWCWPTWVAQRTLHSADSVAADVAHHFARVCAPCVVDVEQFIILCGGGVLCTDVAIAGALALGQSGALQLRRDVTIFRAKYSCMHHGFPVSKAELGCWWIVVSATSLPHTAELHLHWALIQITRANVRACKQCVSPKAEK